MRIMRYGMVGAAVVLLGLSSGTLSATHTLAATHVGAVTKTVNIVSLGGGKFGFKPKTLTITKGTKVVWMNTTSAAHTITADKKKGGKPIFNKGDDPSKSTAITFSKAGTYTYYCAIHPYMKGKIIVK